MIRRLLQHREIMSGEQFPHKVVIKSLKSKEKRNWYKGWKKEGRKEWEERKTEDLESN